MGIDGSDFSSTGDRNGSATLACSLVTEINVGVEGPWQV
jgi:hypothetical protein